MQAAICKNPMIIKPVSHSERGLYLNILQQGKFKSTKNREDFNNLINTLIDLDYPKDEIESLKNEGTSYYNEDLKFGSSVYTYDTSGVNFCSKLSNSNIIEVNKGDITFDYYINLKKFGFNDYTRKFNYLHIISLEDSLDLLLNLLCNCDFNCSRGLENYKNISKGLTTLDLNKLNFRIYELYECLDDNFRLYINKLYKYNFDLKKLTYTFIFDILKTGNILLEAIFIYLRSLKLSSVAFSYGELVFASDTNFFEEYNNQINIKEICGVDYILNVNTYSTKEFPNIIKYSPY